MKKARNVVVSNRSLFSIDTIYATPIDIIAKLKRSIDIKFDDDVIVENCTPKKVIIFRSLLNVLNGLPSFPINSYTWIDNFLVNKYFTKGTYSKLFSILYRDYIQYTVKGKRDNDIANIIDKFARNVYSTMNNLIKDFSTVINKYAIGIEITDVLELQLDERLMDAIANVHKDPSQKNIEKTYNAIDDIIDGLPDNNNIKLLYKSGMVSANQFRQLIGSVGYRTEINSKIFSSPYANSFTLGAKNIYELVIESRAAAKALNFANSAISQSEHLARELQLVTMVVEKVVPGDCGNHNYRDFTIRPKEYDDDTGRLINKGDFSGLIGKYYYDTELKEEIAITPDMKSKLEGKTIKLRQAIRCKLSNKKHICHKCFGDLFYSVFGHQNLGHLTLTTLTRAVTQTLLSAKHLTKSADTTNIVLKANASAYFYVKDDKLFINKRFKNKKTKSIKLYIPQREVLTFNNVIEMGDVSMINLSKASRISKIYVVEYQNDNIISSKEVEIGVNSRKGMLTDNMWQYIIDKGYSVTDDNKAKDIDIDYYVIDMIDYNFDKPIVRYERKEYDFNTLKNEFKKLITKRNMLKDPETGRLVPEYSPEVLVEKIYELINDKLNINIALIEVLVYAFTAYDYNNNNFDLGRNSPNDDLVKMSYAIDLRSLGSALNWNGLESKLYNSMLFKDTGKIAHPLDVLLLPNKVVENYKRSNANSS